MKKRLLSALLALILVISLMPTVVFAETTTITNIQVSGVAAPVAGQTASYNYTLPADAGYEKDVEEGDNCAWVVSDSKPSSYNVLRNDTWYYPTDDESLVFEGGKYYTFIIFATVKEGYSFADEVTGTVNGMEANTYPYSLPGQYDVWYTFYCDTPVAEDKVIRDVTVTHVKAPVAGEDTSIGVIVDCKGIKSYGLSWAELDEVPTSVNQIKNATYYSNSFTAKAGKVYVAVASFMTEEGYRFASDWAATVNGSAATFVEAPYENTAVVYYVFDQLPLPGAIDLWVNGVQVHEGNMSDILGSSSGISFDPATGTLTFAKMANLSQVHEGYAIYSALGKDLNIALKDGPNTIPSIYSDAGVSISANTGAPVLYSAVNIHAAGDVNISNAGSGIMLYSTATITGKNITISAKTDGAPLCSSGMTIDASGKVEITNDESVACAYLIGGSLTVKNSSGVTLKAQCNVPLLTGAPDITSTGDVTITSLGSSNVIASNCKIKGKNVTITGKTTSPMITGNVEIDAAGKVTLINDETVVGSQLVAGSLTITKSTGVELKNNTSSAPTIGNAVNIKSTGDVSVTNAGTGFVFSSETNITGKNVTITGKNTIDAPLCTSSVTIDATGDVKILNEAAEGKYQLVSGTLTVKNSASVTLKAHSGTSPMLGTIDVTSTGDVSITNLGSGFVTYAPSTIKGNNISINGNTKGNPVCSTLEIDATGKVEIINDDSAEAAILVSGTLNIKNATDVTLRANTSAPLLVSPTTINATGDVSITNLGKNITLNGGATIKGRNVTVTGKSQGTPMCTGNVEIDATGKVVIHNDVTEKGYMLVSGNLNIKNSTAVSLIGFTEDAPLNGGVLNVNTSGDVLIVNNGANNAVGNNLSVTVGSGAPMTFGENITRTIKTTAPVAEIRVSKNADGSGYTAWAGEDPSAYHYVYIKATTYTLTTQVEGGNGRVSDGKAGIVPGTVETVTFTPNEGYMLDKVTVNGTEVTVTGNTLEVTMDGNKAVIVTYKEIPHVHAFDQQVASSDHVKTAPTCKAPGVYFKSCVCGENGTETFVGTKLDPENHESTEFTYTNNKNGTHKKLHKCCGAVANDKGACSYGSDNVCDSCGYKKTTSGNQGSTDKPGTDSPATGDSSQLLLWMTMMALSACCLAAMVFTRKRRAR